MTGARLVLLRHGEAATGGRCAGRRFDPPLSPRGREQARSALARLPERPDVLVTSPAARARQTAQVWAGYPASAQTPRTPQAPRTPQVLIPQAEDDLAERDFGAWEGRPWEELWASVPARVLTDPDEYAAFTPPDAEPTEAVADRAWRAARRLTEDVEGTVLAVTHAGPLRLIVGQALGIDAARTFALAVPHARAAVLVRNDQSWTLERLGA